MRMGGELEAPVAIEASFPFHRCSAAAEEQAREGQEDEEETSHATMAAQPWGSAAAFFASGATSAVPASSAGSRFRSQASSAVFISLHHLK